MTNLKTTIGVIKSHSPCEPGWKKLCKSLGTTRPETEVTLSQIFKSNGVQDAYWALNKCWDYRDWCLLIADVIDIPKVRNHSCSAVREMPDAIRGWHAGTVTDEQLAEAAWEAEWAAARAAWAERAAWEAAWEAARAARAEWSAEAEAASWERNEKLMREFCNGENQ